MGRPVHKKRRHEGSHPSQGFSLIEVMFSMAILSVSILGLLALTLTSMRVNAQDDVKIGAVRLTSQVAEILLAQPMSAVPAGLCGMGPEITSLNATSSSTADATPGTGGVTPNVTTDYTYGATNLCLGSAFRDHPNPIQAIQKGTVHYNVFWTTTDLSSDLKMIQIGVYYPNPGTACLPDERWTGCGVNSVTLYKHRAI